MNSMTSEQPRHALGGLVKRAITALGATLALVSAIPSVVQAQAPMKQVDIAMGANTITFAPVYIALKAGYFKEEGIDSVNLIVLRGGAAANSAVASGKPFIGWSGGNDIIAAAATGQPVRMIGLTLNRMGNTLAISKAFLKKTGVPVTAPLEKRIQALKGARIAAGAIGTGGYVFVTDLLRAYGVDPLKDVKLLGMSAEPAVHVTAMREGQIDVSALSPPTVNILIHEGLAELYVSPPGEDVPMFANQTNHAVLANVDALKDPVKRATMEALMRGVTRAAILIKRDPAKAIGYLEQQFPNLPPAVVAEAFRMIAPAIPEDGTPTEVVVNAGLAVAKRIGVNVRHDGYNNIADPGMARAAYAAVRNKK